MFYLGCPIFFYYLIIIKREHELESSVLELIQQIEEFNLSHRDNNRTELEHVSEELEEIRRNRAKEGANVKLEEQMQSLQETQRDEYKMKRILINHEVYLLPKAISKVIIRRYENQSKGLYSNNNKKKYEVK